MSQNLRPQSLKLRKVTRQRGSPRWVTRWGHKDLAYDYAYEVGNLHVIDWLLHRATKDLISPKWYNHIESRIGRYLDGEEDQEGLYR